MASNIPPYCTRRDTRAANGLPARRKPDGWLVVCPQVDLSAALLLAYFSAGALELVLDAVHFVPALDGAERRRSSWTKLSFADSQQPV